MTSLIDLQHLVIQAPAKKRKTQLMKLCHGRYVEPQKFQDLNLNDQQRLRILAVSSTGDKLVVSHSSAALLHGLATVYQEKYIHFRALKRRSSSAQNIKIHWYQERFNVVKESGVLMTTVRQTVLDCAKEFGYAQGLVIADSALKQGLSKEKLEGEHLPKVQKVLENCTALSGSAGETLCRVVLQVLGLKSLILQQEFFINGKRYYTDFYFKELKLVVEFDGVGKYQGEYQRPDQVYLKERNRDSDLASEGITVIHLVWSEIHSPATMLHKFLNYLPFTLSFSALCQRYRKAGLMITS